MMVPIWLCEMSSLIAALQSQHHVTNTPRMQGAHTVSASVLHDSAHTHRRSAFQQRPGHNGVGSRDGLAATSDGEDAVVNALDDLADAGFHASLVAQVCDVLPAFPNDDARFLGRDNRPQGQLGLSILLVRLGRRLSVRAQARLVVTKIELVHGLGKVSPVGRDRILRRRHCG
jgi:hypothetical protein